MVDAHVCDPKKLIAQDPWLAPHEHKLRDRCAHYQAMLGMLDASGGLLHTGEISESKKSVMSVMRI